MKAILLICCIDFCCIPAIQAQLGDSLIFAIRRHQCEKVRQAVTQGYPINNLDNNGANLLMWAVYAGELDLAKWLADHGAVAPDHGAIVFNRGQSYYGSLPAIAAAQGNLAALQWLDSALHLSLETAEYNPVDHKNNGWSPLIWAVNKNRPNVVKYLLRRSVHLAAFDGHHTPVTFFAVRTANMAMLQLLLDAGADPSVEDSSGNDLLKYLNLYNHTRIASLATYLTATFYRRYDSLLKTSSKGKNWPLYRSLAYRTATAARKEFGKGSQQLEQVGLAFYDRNAYGSALPIFLEVAQQRRANGQQDYDYALLLDYIGVSYEDNQNDQALAYYRDARKLLEKLGPKHLDMYGVVSGNIARVCKEMGRNQEAIEAFQKAITALRNSPSGNPFSIINNIFALGEVFQDVDDLASANSTYQQGLNVLDSVQLDPDSTTARALNDLAWHLRKAGNYSAALSIVQRATEMIAAVMGTDNLTYADCLDDAGGIYQLMNIYDMQLKDCLEAYHIREKYLQPNDDDILTSLNNVGFAYERNDQYSVAIGYYNRAIKLTLANRPIDSSGYATLLHNLARCYTEKKEYARALPVHLKELELNKIVNTENSTDYALSLGTLADLYKEMKDYHKALETYKKTVALESRVYGEQHEIYLSSVTDLGELYLLNENPDSAAKLFIKSNCAYQSYLQQANSFLSNDEKMTIANSATYRYEYLPSMLFSSTTGKSGRKMAMEVYNEQLFLKGLILQDQREVLYTVQQSKDPVTRQLFQEWKDDRMLLGRQTLLSTADRTVDLGNLAGKISVLEQKLSARSFAFQQSQKIQVTGTKEVGKALKEGEAAIEFIKFDLYEIPKHSYGDSTIYAALILRHNDSVPVFIPLFEERQLYNVITDDSDAVNTGSVVSELYEEQDEDSRQTPGSLYSLVWKPIEPALKDVNKIYYSPAGLLNLVSFDAIKISPSKYMLDTIEMVRTSSTRSICFPPRPYASPQTAAVWGNIRYGRDTIAGTHIPHSDTMTGKSNEQHLGQPTTGEQAWVDILGARDELGTVTEVLIANQVAVSVDSGREATEDRFKSFDGSSPELIHIATHGFFLGQKKKPKGEDSLAINLENQENPMFRSGLVLAGANNFTNRLDRLKNTEDGILTAYEIANMSLANTKLVVLSACQTGIGEVLGSEGVFGMQRAFKIAGVGQIIATLWSVDDSETVELMTMFYRNLYSGMPARDALRSAQLTMRNDHHPASLWGAFMLID